MAHLDHFYHEFFGDPSRPKLVLLHGVMGYSANWRRVTNRLADFYHVLVYDQRGHGRSFHPAQGYTAEDYANDLRLILEELGWSQIFLIGHSMGGRNALSFAAESPQRVKALVIEDIAPSRPSAQRTFNEEMLALVPTPFATRKAAKEYFLNDFVALFPGRPRMAHVGQFLYSNLTERDDGLMDWRFYRPGILESIRDGTAMDRWPLLKKISMPTLVVRGGDSDYLSREDYARMLEASPFLQGAEIPGAGHFVHAEEPGLFTDAVLAFLAQVRTVAKGPL